MANWTKRNGELVDRKYIRCRAMQKMRGTPWRDVAIAATIDNDDWMKGRDGMLVECVVEDAQMDGLRAWANDDEAYTAYLRELHADFPRPFPLVTLP